MKLHPDGTPLIENKCPHCGKAFNAAAMLHGALDATPSPEDVTICVGCGEFSVYGPKLKLRKPTKHEELDIAMNRDCQLAWFAWKTAVGNRRATH